MRRFTVNADQIDGDRVTFDADESRHLTRVLRLRPGDTIIAADSTGRELTVRLETVGETARGVAIDVGSGVPEPPVLMTLLQGIPKGDRMEQLVRAVTELGVARILPVVAERTVVRLDPARWRDRARRWQRVAREATKQCRRAVIPPVEPPRPLAEWLAAVPPADASELRICCWEGDAPPLRQVLVQEQPIRSVAVLVGPEGGLTTGEVEAARARGFAAVSLGRRILRTETAGPAVIAILQWQLGDLGQ